MFDISKVNKNMFLELYKTKVDKKRQTFKDILGYWLGF